MKRSHIIALGAIAVAVMVIISTVGDASTYVSFTEAKSLAEDGVNKPIHVVGELKKSNSGRNASVVSNDIEFSKIVFSSKFVAVNFSR